VFAASPTTDGADCREELIEVVDLSALQILETLDRWRVLIADDLVERFLFGFFDKGYFPEMDDVWPVLSGPGLRHSLGDDESVHQSQHVSSEIIVVVAGERAVGRADRLDDIRWSATRDRAGATGENQSDPLDLMLDLTCDPGEFS
jgi:hypothetical protein